MKNKKIIYITLHILIFISGLLSGALLYKYHFFSYLKSTAKNFYMSLSTISKPEFNISEQGFKIVDIISSVDSKIQKAYFYISENDKPMPLIVHLHGWGGNYTTFEGDYHLGELCKQLGFNYIYPDFRGSNNTPESCMSHEAISDIDDAINFAIQNANIDTEKISIIGASGGGMAALTMYLKSGYEIKYIGAWCPISDIEQWYYQTKYSNLQYYKDIEQIVKDPLNIHEIKNRSPLYMNFDIAIINIRKNTKLDIFHGINDGYTGTVSPLHSILFFNKLIKLSDLNIGGGGVSLTLKLLI
jgi:dipeptidyl aminopeptidase/acylaminoacyl peptidase